MAIKVTLNDITSGHGTTDLLNTNFTTIEDEFDNCLSLDGTAPNQMQAALDMNGYALLNVASWSTDFNSRGDWATATAYAVGDYVYVDVSDSATNGGGSYWCQTAHTSGTFDTDLSGGNWVQVAARGATGAAGGLDPANNLSDLSNLTTALNNLITAHGALTTADIADEAITLAKIADGTAGDILYWDATGEAVALAVGSDGEVLTLASGVPTWSADTSLTAATQAEQEAGTSTTVATTPGRQHYHPGMAKAWVKFNGSDGSIDASYNVSTVSRTGAGRYTITFTNAMSSAHYMTQVTCSQNSGASVSVDGYVGNDGSAHAPTSSAVKVICKASTTGADTDPVDCYVIVYGDL